MSRATHALTDLGFSEIEALVYCFLLAENPVSGYRVAQGIGKAVANTYKAIDALAQRGAVFIDEGETKLVRPVPPAELMAALSRDLETKRERAVAALKDLTAPAPDERVYRLQTAEQALTRARAMLAQTAHSVLGDLFPLAVEALTPALQATAKRGVKVWIKTYAPVEIRGVSIIPARDPARILASWPGQQLSLVADAQAHLFALFSRDLETLHQGVWSNSVFLSCLAYSHVASELTRAGGTVLGLLRDGPPGLTDLRSTYGQTLRLKGV